MRQSHTRSDWSRIRLATGRVLLILFSALLSVAFLVACDEEDHRAIPPGSVRQASSPSPTESPQQERGGDPGVQWDEPAGAVLPDAQHIYFTHGGDVWQLPADGPASAVIIDHPLIAISSSALGDRLAALSVHLSEAGTEEGTTLAVVDPSGATAIEITAVQDQLDRLGLGLVDDIAISPDGVALAMSHRTGAVTRVGLDGDLRILVEPHGGYEPGALNWSPDGGLLTYLDPWQPNRASNLYVVVPESGARQIIVPGGPDRDGVVTATWIPGTAQIAVVLSSGSTIQYGGDVFVVDVRTSERNLLVSAGEFAPVAGVVDIAVSPGGEYLAATVFAPGPERPEFRDLLLIDLVSSERTFIDVEPNRTVTDLWWLDGKLVYRVVDEPRTKMPGVYTGVESYSLIEYHPENGNRYERHRHD